MRRPPRVGIGLLCSSATANTASGLVWVRTQAATLSPPGSVNCTELTGKSDARVRSRPPDRHSNTMATTAAVAVIALRCSIFASSAPTRMLPSSAQKTKNLVLSHTHGWSTTRFGTTNHSHIGANHFGKATGCVRRTRCATSKSGSSSEVFQTQNHSHPRKYSTGPSLTTSPGASHPSWRQKPPSDDPGLQTLVLSGGSIHSRVGTPTTSAGTKKASHSLRLVNKAQ